MHAIMPALKVGAFLWQVAIIFVFIALLATWGTVTVGSESQQRCLPQPPPVPPINSLFSGPCSCKSAPSPDLTR